MLCDINSKDRYYSDDDVVLINDNSLEFLKKLPSGSVDMIFADPPYFGNQSNQILNRTDGHKPTFDTQKATWAFSKDLITQFEFHHAWLTEAKRLLKDGGTIWITGTYHSIGVVNVVLQDLKYKILNDIILVKKNAPPNFTGSCFRAITESMLWAKKSLKGRTKWNYTAMKQINGGIQMSNVWEYRAEKNPFRHPATKQQIILEKVILAGSHEGDVVLDPFAGSGTTGYVCKGLNRKCLMIELEEPYCELIAKRLKGEFGVFQPKIHYEKV